MPDDLRYAHVLSFVTSNVWAIEPSKMHDIMAFVCAKATGDSIDPETIAEMQAAAQTRPKQQKAAGGVAVLPVFGTISRRMNMMSAMSGGTSVEQLTQTFRALVNDPDIGAIVLDVDSPGGTVDGLPELADEVYRARGKKPITAVANRLMASGAYWLAASADEIVVTSSALVGSIGVIASHDNRSAMMEKLGVEVSLITAGKYKGEGNPFEPLGEDARAHMQSLVDASYGLFTKAVARGRGVPVETVRNGFGEGRVVTAKEAVALGMADRIVGSLDEVVATIGRSRDAGQQDIAAFNMSSGGGAGQAINRIYLDKQLVWQGSTIGSTMNGWTPPAAQTFESESDAALTAVRNLQARVEALTALREDRNTPVSQARVPMLMEHRDAYRAVADAYDALVAACRSDAAETVVRASRHADRLRLHDLDLLLIEN